MAPGRVRSRRVLHLIDFEYGAYNHRGFDFGNHFNEWAGFDCDYARCAPTFHLPSAFTLRIF